ncbi:UbiA family prenyltransferase [Prauserella cavernicola]|uniref:UbiA prenyltransferase family protein n=1 Tax=Prauserella cavernicola TaxID=2800127 RepID=A0A934V383_9PSEU|nr:UbiA family prenyltransferase [Prauserella cavernicola]MBK1786986.1 UbiA prenyltransferase family protein [Prauserella cavernicola]
MSRLTAPRWRDLAVVHRLEYTLPVSYLCYAVLGACVAADGAEQAAIPVLLAVVANLLLIVGPLALNVAADLRADERNPEKRYLASATTGVGRVRTLRWAVTELTVGAALACVVTVWTGSWPVALVAAAIIALQVAYNLEPLRLKRRGLAGPAAFGIASVGLPFLLSYAAVSHAVPGSAWLLAAGVGVLSTGRTLWWSLPDRAADAATGIAVPVARFGVRGTRVLTCAVLVAGLVLLVAGLWLHYGPAWALLGSAGHAIFTGWLAVLALRPSGHAAPSARRMLTRSLTLVALSEVLLVATALGNL